MQVVCLKERSQMPFGPGEHSGSVVILFNVTRKCILLYVVADQGGNDRRNTDGNNHIVIRRDKELDSCKSNGQVEKDIYYSLEFLMFAMIAMSRLIEICSL